MLGLQFVKLSIMVNTGTNRKKKNEKKTLKNRKKADIRARHWVPTDTHPCRASYGHGCSQQNVLPQLCLIYLQYESCQEFKSL